MGGRFDKLGEHTLDVISNIEGTSGCFSEIEKGFTGIKTMLSTSQRRSSMSLT